METANPDVSICIATFRRPDGLARLLDSLSQLKVPPGVVVESIVIDNDPAGSASPVVRARPEGLRPLYFVEPRQNIAHARNRALAEASGSWLLFIDDDEVPDENWLNAYLEMLDRIECDGAFGPVIPKLESIGTRWLDVDTFYSAPRHESGSRVPTPDLCTSNAIVRRSLFADCSFDPAFGLSGGEDTELFGRLEKSGACFLWCDEARVTDRLPRERHRLGWLSRRAFGGGCVHSRLRGTGTFVEWALQSARASLLLCAFALLTPLAGCTGRRRGARFWLRACTQAGHLWTLSGGKFERYRARSRVTDETRIAILTNTPTPYRTPVFDQIAASPGVEALVLFDGASDATVTEPDNHYPHQYIAPILSFGRRNYQDEDAFAEHLTTRFAFGYLPKLMAFRPDVIVSGEFGWRTLQAAAYALVARVPLLVWWEGTKHTERKVSRLRIALRRLLARSSAGLLGFGQVSVDYLEDLENLAGARSKIFFVPQTVDNEKIAQATDRWRAERDELRRELGVRGVVLLCLGRMMPHKGIAPYLDALHRLRVAVPEGSFTAVFAGEGPETARVEAAAAEFGGAVRAIGKVCPDEVPRLLAAADVLVFPTLRDCWGMVVNEALAAGVPVLGSRYAGAAQELLAAGDVGTLIDPLDPESLDTALLAVVRDRSGLGEGPDHFRQALTGYSSQDAADAILRAAKQVLERSK